MVLPVKVLIDRDTHLAHTIDITPGGARLGALRQELKVGTTITLQRGAKRGKFRVAWIKQLAPGEAGRHRGSGAERGVLGGRAIRLGTAEQKRPAGVSDALLRHFQT